MFRRAGEGRGDTALSLNRELGRSSIDCGGSSSSSWINGPDRDKLDLDAFNVKEGVAWRLLVFDKRLERCSTDLDPR